MLKFVSLIMNCSKKGEVYSMDTKYYHGLYEEVQNLSGVVKTHYINTPDGIVAAMIDDGTTSEVYYITSDHLGSFCGLLDDNASVVEEHSFDAWGRRRNPNDWSYNNIPGSGLLDRGFTGHEHIDLYNVINMNGRIYDPFLGRFLSPDPVIQDAGNTQSYNAYSYVFNNPLIYTDPSGYSAVGGGPNYQLYENQRASSIARNNYYDFIYHRGDYNDLLGGGFEGLCAFHPIGGSLYQYSANGTITSTNKNDNMMRLTYRNGGFGFYSQVSGTWVTTMLNGKSVGFQYSEIKCIWMNYGESLPSWNDVGWKSSSEFEKLIYQTNSEGVNWYDTFSKIMNRFSSPDFIALGVGFNAIAGAGAGTSVELRWVTRGPQASWKPMVTLTQSVGGGGALNGTLNIEAAYYAGDENHITRKMMNTDSRKGKIPTIWGCGGSWLVGGTGYITPNVNNSFIFGGELNIGPSIPIFVGGSVAGGVSNTYILHDFY